MKKFVFAFLTGAAGLAQTSLSPTTMPRMAVVDERFQSFNVEMVEVTGGRFWKPFGKDVDAILNAPKAAGGPVGMDPNLYQNRPPIDLYNPRLRKLATALGPAYVRVSGTWANSTYFGNTEPAPDGFGSVLKQAQWKGIVDFSKAVDAKIVTSFATSAGTRDKSGTWTPAQAQAFLDYNKSIGGNIAAAEFMNEPTFAEMGGAPKGYDAAAYARDLAVFLPFIRKSAPGLIVLGPGSVGEGISIVPPSMGIHILTTEDLLTATGPVFDAFSYHFYGTVSKRCAGGVPGAGTTPAAALSSEWLSRTAKVEEFYGGLRDKFMPGKPIWLTETADTACGGNPWGSTFLDSFRYLNQLGILAQKGVQVLAHNTLASSDYGLIDENTFTPRPNYWSAVLWRRLTGTTVLNPGPTTPDMTHLYAQCLRGQPGGVALLIINADRTGARTMKVPRASVRYTLTAQTLESGTVRLNGVELKLGAKDELPELTGVPAKAGELRFAPASITFLALPHAHNNSCK
jgi:heparanase 1